MNRNFCVRILQGLFSSVIYFIIWFLHIHSFGLTEVRDCYVSVPIKQEIGVLTGEFYSTEWLPLVFKCAYSVLAPLWCTA